MRAPRLMMQQHGWAWFTSANVRDSDPIRGEPAKMAARAQHREEAKSKN